GLHFEATALRQFCGGSTRSSEAGRTTIAGWYHHGRSTSWTPGCTSARDATRSTPTPRSHGSGDAIGTGAGGTRRGMTGYLETNPRGNTFSSCPGSRSRDTFWFEAPPPRTTRTYGTTGGKGKR